MDAHLCPCSRKQNDSAEVIFVVYVGDFSVALINIHSFTGPLAVPVVDATLRVDATPIRKKKHRNANMR